MNCQVLVNATGLEPVITSLKGRSLIPIWPCVHVEDRTRVELVIPRGKRFADVCLAIRPTVHILVGSVGIEPTTFTLRGCCYYQLSYEPLFLVEAERIELS